MEEVWKDVPGFLGYQVSDAGNVRSRRRWGGKQMGLGKDWRFLSPCLDRKGYPTVYPYHDRKRHARRVHRLVLEAFVGPRPPKFQACHKDDDKQNNKLANLRWDIQENNMKDATQNGVWKRRKSRGPWCLMQSWKLDAGKVREIRRLYQQGISQVDIAKRFGISGRHVNDVVHRRIWKHIE